MFGLISKRPQAPQEPQEIFPALRPREARNVLHQNGARPQEFNRRKHCREAIARIVRASTEATG